MLLTSWTFLDVVGLIGMICGLSSRDSCVSSTGVLSFLSTSWSWADFLKSETPFKSFEVSTSFRRMQLYFARLPEDSFERWPKPAFRTSYSAIRSVSWAGAHKWRNSFKGERIRLFQYGFFWLSAKVGSVTVLKFQKISTNKPIKYKETLEFVVFYLMCFQLVFRQLPLQHIWSGCYLESGWSSFPFFRLESCLFGGFFLPDGSHLQSSLSSDMLLN